MTTFSNCLIYAIKKKLEIGGHLVWIKIPREPAPQPRKRVLPHFALRDLDGRIHEFIGRPNAVLWFRGLAVTSSPLGTSKHD